MADSAAEAGTTPRTSAVRQRILEAADRLFYVEGIRAVSADRIIAAAEVSKVTFYRHFPTKDDLVLAYLAGRSELERTTVESLREQHPEDACGALEAIARAVADISCATGFRGCPFINAAAEYADSDHPVRQAVASHRQWFADLLTELLSRSGVRDCATAVPQLVMLRDGAMIGGYLGLGTDVRANTLINAGKAVIATLKRT